MSFKKLVKNVLKGESLDGIFGICYRDNGNIIEANGMELLSDLDQLPIPNYDIIETVDKIKKISIETGRGCPFNCNFCSTKTFWKRKVRYKSIARIIL